MKKEYIERTGLLESLALSDHPWSNFEDAYEIVQNVPAEDVAPVVHGEWKPVRGMAPPEYHGRHICSECGKMAKEWKMHEILTDYCPNCGAKMDGEKKQNDV